MKVQRRLSSFAKAVYLRKKRCDMIATAVAENLITLEDFIRMEQTAEVKHEFRNGKLHEMPGSRFPTT
jgi:hypothetical protein